MSEDPIVPLHQPLYQKKRRFREDYPSEEDHIQQKIIAERCKLLAREIRSRREKK